MARGSERKAGGKTRVGRAKSECGSGSDPSGPGAGQGQVRSIKTRPVRIGPAQPSPALSDLFLTSTQSGPIWSWRQCGGIFKCLIKINTKHIAGTHHASKSLQNIMPELNMLQNDIKTYIRSTTWFTIITKYNAGTQHGWNSLQNVMSELHKLQQLQKTLRKHYKTFKKQRPEY